MTDISRKETLYNIITAYPEVKSIMADLGFSDILKPGMLQTMGKVMTIEKGGKMKHLAIEKIDLAFEAKGYKLT